MNSSGVSNGNITLNDDFRNYDQLIIKVKDILDKNRTDLLISTYGIVTSDTVQANQLNINVYCFKLYINNHLFVVFRTNGKILNIATDTTKVLEIVGIKF